MMTTVLATRQNEERAGKCRANLGRVRTVTRSRASAPAEAERAVNQSRNSRENRSRGHATGRARPVADALRWPRAIGAPVQSKPAVAGRIGQIGAAVAAHALDRQPFEGWPAVGSIPLLTRGDQRRDESAGLQELPLEARRDRPTLLGSREPEIQRG